MITAYQEFRAVQSDFYTLACEFYLRLNNKMQVEMDIPNGKTIKYSHKTGQNSNIIDDCVFLENEEAVYKIDLIVEDITHSIEFRVKKATNGGLTLTLTVDNKKGSFEFDITTKSQAATLDFEPVFEYITDTIVGFYSKAEASYRLV